MTSNNVACQKLYSHGLIHELGHLFSESGELATTLADGAICLHRVHNYCCTSCCKVFPFQEISDGGIVYENSSVEDTYDHYKLMDKCSQFNLISLNYSDCRPHNFGNDRPKILSIITYQNVSIILTYNLMKKLVGLMDCRLYILMPEV